MLARYFIDRPVLANVIALVTLIVGTACLYFLPVSQYPDISPPTIVVTAAFPGANAETLAKNVAFPIENMVDGVEGMVYMRSTSSSEGLYSLTVSFAAGTNSDLAQTLVQNRVSTALSSLPAPVQALGVTTKKVSTSMLAIISLTSNNPRHDNLFLSNYANINLRAALERLPGVGKVDMLGGTNYSMRVWLNPQLMQARNLIPSDVTKAIVAQGSPVTAGQIGSPPVPTGQMFQYTVDVSGQLDDAKQYENIVIKTASGKGSRVVRLKDVARVELGSESYNQTFTLHGRPAAGMAVHQLPGSNALVVIERVEQALLAHSNKFPVGMAYEMPFDSTRFVAAAIRDVYMTMIQAAVLVLVVIVIFVQDWRASLVPATTVPVTIIGAFAAMAALGFSINLTTMFAIVLAIGIVVDDAIVVVEGAAGHIENGRSAREAAALAMDDLFGPIVAITLVLVAVFVPVAFLPGISGQMYGQFALVIAATALISAMNAVTLKPAQCARWLRARPAPEKRNFVFRKFSAGLGLLERQYIRIVAATVRRYGVVSFLALCVAGTSLYGFSQIPTSFIPSEDQGYFLVGVELPAGAALGRTAKVMAKVGNRLKSISGVKDVVMVGGFSLMHGGAQLSNAGFAYVVLDDWALRGRGKELSTIMQTANAEVHAVPGAKTQVFAPPSVPGLGTTSGYSLQVMLRDGSLDIASLVRTSDELVDRLRRQPKILKAYASQGGFYPHIKVDIDRTRTQTLAVSFEDIFSTLGIYIGSDKPLQFVKFGQLYYVTVQAEGRFRALPEDIERLSVRNSDGNMVPIGAFAKVRSQIGPSVLTLFNRQLAVEVSGLPASDAASGDALASIDRVAAEVLPSQFGYEFSGISREERSAGNLEYYVFLLAIVLIYLILAALYGSWLAPFPVILSAPLAFAGTAALMLALGISNNLYTQIGTVLLIALISKNAILIVEFARLLRRRDKMDIAEAAINAAQRRFRPIVMTSLTFILGVVPMIFASGPAANAQNSIGVTVISGMLVATILTLIFVPSFFVLFQRLEETISARQTSAVAAASPPSSATR